MVATTGLRCPECGVTTDRGSAEFPLCRQCHLPLIICGTCQHFERRENNGRGACGNRVVPGRLLMEVGSTPNCRHFAPRLRTRTAWEVKPAAWVVLGVIIVLALMLPLAFLALRASRGPRLRVQASGPEALAVGERGMAVLDIRDMGGVEGQIDVGLSAGFFRKVRVTGVDPKPVAQGLKDGYFTLSYHAPGPCYPLLVRLEFIGQEAGNHALDVRISNSLHHLVRAQLSIVVTTSAARGAG